MFLFATCVYLRGSLRVRLVTQRNFFRKFNLRPLAGPFDQGLGKLQNTLQLTPSLNLLLPQSRSRHNLHNKVYIKTTNIPRSFIHCGTAERGSTLVQLLLKYLFIDCGTADRGSTSV